MLDAGRTASLRLDPLLDLFILLFPAGWFIRPLPRNGHLQYHFPGRPICYRRVSRKDWKAKHRLFCLDIAMGFQSRNWDSVCRTGQL